MSVQWVLLPVFVLVGLTFAVLGIGASRARGQTGPGDIHSGNLFELPVLFYALIALALPLRHADLIIVMLSWVFVITCFAHAGILVTSSNTQPRGTAWFAGVLVLFAMWLYFALKILLLI